MPPNTLRIESFLDLCDNPAVISLHLQLLQDAGFIESRGVSRNDYIKGVEVQRMTLAGYEYLKSVRSAKIYTPVSKRASRKIAIRKHQK